jgi:hypothetical protein
MACFVIAEESNVYRIVVWPNRHLQWRAMRIKTKDILDELVVFVASGKKESVKL